MTCAGPRGSSLGGGQGRRVVCEHAGYFAAVKSVE